jgi:hypothetical protein
MSLKLRTRSKTAVKATQEHQGTDLKVQWLIIQKQVNPKNKKH